MCPMCTWGKMQGIIQNAGKQCEKCSFCKLNFLSSVALVTLGKFWMGPHG